VVPTKLQTMKTCFPCYIAISLAASFLSYLHITCCKHNLYHVGSLWNVGYWHYLKLHYKFTNLENKFNFILPIT
jgi:hypothetical protein